MLTTDKEQALGQFMVDNFEACARSYSGRAMYGEHCIGFTYGGDKQYFKEVLDILGDLRECSFNYDELKTIFLSYSQDSMGYGIIIYFPSIAWDKNWELSDDDEDDD